MFNDQILIASLMRGAQELEFAASTAGQFGHTRMALKSVRVDGYLLDSTQVERLWRDGKIKLMEPPGGGLSGAHFTQVNPLR